VPRREVRATRFRVSARPNENHLAASLRANFQGPPRALLSRLAALFAFSVAALWFTLVQSDPFPFFPITCHLFHFPLAIALIHIYSLFRYFHHLRFLYNHVRMLSQLPLLALSLFLLMLFTQ
jgi:hypothetical protein